MISQGIILNDVAREHIVERLEAQPVDGYLLWVDKLDELAAESKNLRDSSGYRVGCAAASGRSSICTGDTFRS